MYITKLNLILKFWIILLTINNYCPFWFTNTYKYLILFCVTSEYNWTNWFVLRCSPWVARLARMGRLQRLLNIKYLWIKNTIFFSLRVGFKFVKHFFSNQSFILAVFNDDLKLFSKSIVTFNDTGLDTKRFDQKIN